MTVLPNAPIDSTTGLPIPTIAVATDGGVSVIKDDGSVVSRAEATGTMQTSFIHFTGNGSEYYYVHGWGSNTHDTRFVIVDSGHLDSNVSLAYDRGNYQAWEAMYNDFSWNLGGVVKIVGKVGDSNVGVQHIQNNTTGNNRGVTKFINDLNNKDKSSVAYLTSTYNSGYMTGDIKGAWNVDTDVTSLSGTDLVSNGSFSSSTGWTADTGWTISGGTATHSGSASYITQTPSTSYVEGKWYVLTCDVVSGGGTFGLVNHGQYSPVDVWVTISGGKGIAYWRQGSVNLTSTNLYSNGSISIDNVVIREAIPDRSVKGNGLAVHGTPTVSAVATGAELKCISTSSGSYMNQVDSDVLAVTSAEDFHISFWWNSFASNDDVVPWYYGSYNGADSIGFLFYVSGGINGKYAFKCGSSSVYSDKTHKYSGWKKLDFIRTSNVLVMYVDGVKQQQTSNNSQAFGNKEFVLGSDDNHSYAQGVSKLSLFKISRTAPTAEQLLEIYEAEKPLFQENAKCTLNGTSDAVQCLAYDDSTELLHVGTSGGRSTFQGLRRVDETATNTTEISAQGGMIIEETA
jgi:hypothetical protein